MTRLDENYTLETDSFNWILRYESERIEKDKDGNDKVIKSTNESYHGSINFALKKYADNVKKINNESVSRLIECTTSLERILTNFKLKKK